MQVIGKIIERLMAAVRPGHDCQGAVNDSRPSQARHRLPRDNSAMSVEEHPHYTAEQGLARLKEGNERFANGQARFPTVQKDVLAELAKGQQPYATILGCSDSRVPPELVFDAGFGELFVIRVAGNVLGPSILGTLQYAASHLPYSALRRARTRVLWRG
jgi:hypothetical protein